MDEKSQHYREVKEKRTILREQYGGMMTLADLMKELGYSSRDSTRRVAQELNILPTTIGRLKRYDTDLVAKALVDRRGMA